MQDNKGDPMISGVRVNDYLDSPNCSFNENVFSELFNNNSNENMNVIIEDRLPNIIFEDETTLEADVLEDRITTITDDFETVETSQAPLALNSEALVAPLVKNYLAPTDDSISNYQQSPRITHPDMLPFGDWKFEALYVSNINEESACCFWKGMNCLYVQPGKAFAMKFEYDATEMNSVIEIYPVYEDESHSHVPVVRSDPAVQAAMGVVGVEDMDSNSYQYIVGMGGRHGVQLSATVHQITLRLYHWRNLNSKREHLPVALHFILYDSERRCRGRDKMSVRVQEKPKRKCQADKKKLEQKSMHTAQQTVKPEPSRKRGTRKRPRQARTNDSDDEPLVNRARNRTNIKLQLELPRTKITEDILQSFSLRCEQAARFSETPDRPFFEKSNKCINKILRQGNFDKYSQKYLTNY